MVLVEETPEAKVTSNDLKKKIGQIFSVLKPGKNQSAREQLFMEQSLNDLSSLLDIFISNPEKITPALSDIQRPSFGRSPSGINSATKSESPYFSDKYTTFARIPKSFLWQMFKDRMGKHLDATKIELIEKHDPDAVRKLLEFDTGRAPSSSVPPKCHEKRILKLALTQASVSLGNRLTEDWIKKAVKPNGDIDWDLGIYRWAQPDGSEVSSYGQAGSKKKVPAGYVQMFQKDKSIKKNWKDQGAYVSMEMGEFKLSTLYGDDKPWEVLTNGHFKSIVDKIAKEAEDAKLASAKQEVIVTDDIEQACKRRRRAAPKSTPQHGKQVA